MDLDAVITYCLSFAEAESKPHFEKISFRVRNKIFATLDELKLQLVVKLTDDQQPAFAAADNAIHPVPGGWGKKGWTVVEIDSVDEQVFKDVLTTSYCNVAPKSLGARYVGDRA